MASLSTCKDGLRSIQFVAPDGRRRTIRLGKVAKRQAEAVKLKVEDLLNAAMTGHAPSRQTSRWVADLDDQMHAKLAKVGLVEARASSTLGPFMAGYIAARQSDTKASTRTVYKRTQKHLLKFFGKDKPLRAITPGDADRWRRGLAENGLADSTVRRTCGVAKQFLNAAIRDGLIEKNPFGDLVAAVRGNTDRMVFVSREQIDAVLEACPDAEWRLLVALARFGGLRVPSEALALKWEDIDWSRDRFRVPSPKTEHHEGKDHRWVPIFPELLPYLRDASELALLGQPYCITRYRDPKVNLRTQFQRIIRRAGVEPWAKLWQNLRSTRQTELADSFPAHVASAWIGNSVIIAKEHYLQVTDEHFEKSLHIPVQSAPVDERTGAQSERDENTESAFCACGQGNAAQCSAPGGERWAIQDSNL